MSEVGFSERLNVSDKVDVHISGTIVDKTSFVKFKRALRRVSETNGCETRSRQLSDCMPAYEINKRDKEETAS